MFNSSTQPKLLIPGLAGFYAWAEPIGYALLRFTIGVIVFVHGYMKIMGPGAAGVTGMFTRMAFPAPGAMAYVAIFFETIGTLCVAFGLFTRFFAAALAVEMLVILITAHWAKGFNVAAGGYEYVLLLGMVYFYIALRGGGRYAVDTKLGKVL
jgi:putative oxidoreductase